MRDPGYQQWIREQPCIMRGRRYESRAGGHVLGPPHECTTPVQCCHVKSRGAGGPDHANCVSMCAWMHDAQHRFGTRSFQSRWAVDLKLEAEQLFRGWVDRGGQHE